MGTGRLSIDLDAISHNWRALDALTKVETGAVVKANGYGLGAGKVATTLARAGARRFFVAISEEGAALRTALGEGPDIFVFAGHMAGDTDMIRDLDLIPMLNSVEQLTRHMATLPGHRFGIQLDTGMNRLGMEPAEWAAVREIAVNHDPALVISHLACADEPEHAMNARQLRTFRQMTDGLSVPRSLAATGGMLLGQDYHFDLTRPGVGLYGGLPFADAKAVATLSLPVIQIRELDAGESVGYGNAWIAQSPATIATIAAGYADGLIRAMGKKAVLQYRGTPCPVRGRVSMDLLTVDITHLGGTRPDHLDILNPERTVDALADAAGTIGYEILTSLGSRYQRHYSGGLQ